MTRHFFFNSHLQNFAKNVAQGQKYEASSGSRSHWHYKFSLLSITLRELYSVLWYQKKSKKRAI